jgi:leucine efflux protein
MIIAPSAGGQKYRELMVYGITDLPTFVLGAVLIVLLPGPNSMYVMAVASRSGVAAGYRAAAGVFLGDTVLMFASVLGLASLLRTVPAVFLVVKFAGAAYLAWMGIGMLRAAWQLWRDRGIAQEARPITVNDRTPFRTALIISLMNPKAILFFLSFFIQFVDAGYAHPGLSFLILGSIVQISSMLYLTTLIFGGAYLAEAFRRRRRMKVMGTGAIGVLFISFSAKLAGATLR